MMKLFILLALFSWSSFAEFTVENAADPAGDAFILVAGPGKHVKLMSGIGGPVVKLGTIEVQDATITLNGTPLKKRTTGFAIDKYSKTPIANIGPGKPLKLEIKAGEEIINMEVVCPQDPQISAPLEGAKVIAGQQISVRWKDELNKDGELAPKLQFMLLSDTFEPIPTAIKFSRDVSNLTEAEVDAQKGVPNSTPAIELRVVGPASKGVRCTLYKRVGLSF